ncbi:MAG: hypothetical protein HQK89_16315 [Nitrospirae bacterium]|nr:hypothetical protein [Nitrospirota bacterium]
MSDDFLTQLKYQWKYHPYARAFRSSPIVSWFIHNRNLIAQVCFLLWAAVMCYWVYKFAGLKVRPCKIAALFHESDELSSRTALVYIFWALTSGIIFLMMGLYIIKFAINIAWGFVEGVFPLRWHNLISSVVLLFSLVPCFDHMGEIKSVYLAVVSQAGDIVHSARQFDLNLKVKPHSEEGNDQKPAESGSN